MKKEYGKENKKAKNVKCDLKGNIKKENGKRNENRNENRNEKKRLNKSTSKCPYFSSCGGCQHIDIPYEEQLKHKQDALNKLLGEFGKPKPIIGMKEPYHYRHKVHAVFGYEKGNVISGIYEEKSHRLVQVDQCLLENEKADAIILTIRSLLKSFKIRTYDEKTDYGLLKHVVVRVGANSGQIMVILVLRSPILPSKNNFVKALLKEHPEITTVVLNVNEKNTTMVLGARDIVLYGKGYIEDELCGMTFRLSPQSFYQVNPVQTEILYQKAMEFANLTGKERVIDAYCGTGTIGLVASKHAKEVIGIELNGEAVKDAVLNAKTNGCKNVRFIKGDATEKLTEMAENGFKADVVFLDPPRSGSTREFLDALCRLSPKRIVYISCGPESLKRDLGILKKQGYQVRKIQPVDLFGHTQHLEVVVMLTSH